MMATLLVTTLVCAALAALPAQGVGSLPLDGAPRIDGLYVAPDGRVFGAGTYTGSEVYRIDEGGSVVTVATGLRGPTHLGMDTAGNLYVSEFNGAAVARVAPDGSVVRYEVGYLYAANFYDGRIVRVAPDGTQELVATVTLPNGNPSPIGHLAYTRGALWASGGRANRIYRISLTGEVETWAGDGTAEDRDGPREQARFAHPNGIAASPDGNTVYVATAGNGAGDRSVIRVLNVSPERSPISGRRARRPGGRSARSRPGALPRR
ncbi:MAG: hypothetical protein PVJ49_03760 [Acidobacteriota bacterium]|jgi:sugar lactone lactonase YvrE